MSYHLQLRKGNTETTPVTPVTGELVVDTGSLSVRVGDGATIGGVDSTAPPVGASLANQLYPEGYVYTILEDGTDQKNPEELGLGTIGTHWTLATLIMADFGGGVLEFYTRTSTQFTTGDVSGWVTL